MAELAGVSDLSKLIEYVKHGRALQRKKAATIIASKLGIPNLLYCQNTSRFESYDSAIHKNLI